jgi:ParB-like chromosome segregation protein Spo0J
MVLGGNMRLKACIEAGLKDVPVKQAKDLTEEQKKEFIIKDNVAFGEHNWDELANSWNVEELTDWGLDIPNFDVIDEKEQIDLSDKLKSEFKIEIICKSEEEQEQTYNKLIEQNYECRLLTL